MFIADIIDSYIKKAGFNDDQPRDEKGRWSSEGGANPERIKVLKDYYSKMSVEEIRQNVRLDKEINPVIERWQASSVSLEAYALKAKIIEMEGLDSSGNRGISDTNKSELLCWHDDLYDPQTKEAELSKVMDALLNSDYEEIKSLGRDIMSVTSEYKEYEHEGVKRDLRLYNVRNSLNVYLEQLGDHPLYSENYNKRVTDAAIKIKNDFDRELKVEDKIKQHAKEIASDSLYYKLKAAGQVIMEKENYPEKITLYRGTSFTNTPTDTVVTSVVSKLTTDGKIVVNSDVLSSWTTIPIVAYAFAASGDLGIVQKETIDRKDIFIPASLIRFDKGNEKEHVVINKKPTVEFNTTNAAIVPQGSGFQEETLNKFLNFGDLKETELDLTYLKKFEILKAGFNDDQPRDDKGRWTVGGGGSGSVSDKHYNEFKAIVDSSPDKYDAYAKIKDIIHTDASSSNALEKWKDSSRGPTSTFLKQRISDFEGVRSRDAMRPDQIWWALDRVCKENPEETKTIFKAVMKQTNADNFKNYKSVMRDRLSDFRRTLKSSKEYGDSVKDAVANARREVVSFAAMSGFYRTDKETARMINKVISSPKVASLVKSKVMDTLTKEGYDKIKGATQALLSKENGVQNHVRLYRGYALSNDPKEVLGIIKKVASGDKKISVKEDGISSYTRNYGLAATFLANSKMYSVIERDVPKKDVVIHPGVFKMWSGEEEYTVLNRKASLPLRVGKDIFLDSFDSIASKVTGGLDSKEASDWLSQASKYKDKYEANRAEIAKAGFNEDQPRDEKGMWTSGGGSPVYKEAYAKYKKQFDGMTVSKIREEVRIKDANINMVIQMWQGSSTSMAAYFLKEKVAEQEGFSGENRFNMMNPAIEKQTKSVNKPYFDKIITDEAYAKLRAAGQAIMEKEGYPDKITLYRGSAWNGFYKEEADEMTKLMSTIAENGKLKIPSDSISSWTSLPEVAKTFAEGGDFGVVQKITVNRSDILIPASLIRYREGKEQEHIVINRSGSYEINAKNSAIVWPTREKIADYKEFKDSILEESYGGVKNFDKFFDRADKFLDVSKFKATKLGISYLKKFDIEKAGYNDDQPRDERGRWTDSGSKLLNLVEKHTSKFKGMSVEQIHDEVRIKDTVINSILSKWESDTRYFESWSLKYQTYSLEGLGNRPTHNFNVIQKVLGSMSEEDAKLLYPKIVEKLKGDEWGDRALGQETNSPSKIGYAQANKELYGAVHTQRLLLDMLHDNKEYLKSEKNFAEKLCPTDSYAKIRAAGQVIMEKEGYTDKILLYRGTDTAYEPKEARSIFENIGLGKTSSLNIKQDSIVSFTPLWHTAYKFTESGNFPVVIAREVERKDILVPASLIRYDEGKEKEHIVINRTAISEYPISSLTLPSVYTSPHGSNQKDPSIPWVKGYKKIQNNCPDKQNLEVFKLYDNETGFRLKTLSGEIEKAGYNEDQPRDEKGRWTSGGGGSGKGKDTLYEYHKDQMKHLNPEQINKLVRKKNKKVNELIHAWQGSATSRGAQTLKEATRLYEDLKKASVRITSGMVLDGIKEAPADSVYKLAESLKIQLPAMEFNAYGEFKGVHWVDAKDIVPKIEELKAKLDAPQEATGVQAALKEAGLDRKPVSEGFKEIVKKQIPEATRIRACSEVVEHYSFLKDYVNRVSDKDAMYKESEKGIAAIEKLSLSDVKNNKNLDKDFPRTTYNQLKAAGQLIMEKQNYPEKVTLLRGLTTKLTANECEKILYSVVNDKTDTDKLKIAVDVLASYTTQRDVAHNFGTSYDGDETMGLVIVRDVPRKDILVPSKLIQYNEGIEKEHIVIHKTPKVDVPLNKIILPNYRELSGHYDMVTNSEGGNLGRSEMIRDIYNEKVSKHNAEVKKYVRDKGHYRLDW